MLVISPKKRANDRHLHNEENKRQQQIGEEAHGQIAVRHADAQRVVQTEALVAEAGDVRLHQRLRRSRGQLVPFTRII